MSTMNPEVQMTLDDAVEEVLGLLTGLDLTYEPELDRYRAITRQLNRALRANALDSEWSYYSGVLPVGQTALHMTEVTLPNNLRPRITNDDAVRLVRPEDQLIVRWAYMLPRDALHKYSDRRGLWCAFVRRVLTFSRPLLEGEEGLEIHVPVMREPKMFRLPPQGKTVPNMIRKQLIDFPYPDAIISRAAYFYAQTDPVMQPRVQQLEGDYKDVLYQLIERDTAHTDSAYVNAFRVPVTNGLIPVDTSHRHPHADY